MGRLRRVLVTHKRSVTLLRNVSVWLVIMGAEWAALSQPNGSLMLMLDCA